MECLVFFEMVGRNKFFLNLDSLQSVQISLNSHTVYDSQLRELGVGLYPVISFINHSCLPNCIVTFEGRQAVARAVQHIPKDTEVSIVTLLHFSQLLWLLDKISSFFVSPLHFFITKSKRFNI